MLQVEEAQRLVLEEIAVLPFEQVAVADVLGRVLREDVCAARDLPPGDNSAMDGYAVRAGDVASASVDRPVRLQVIGDVPAGHPASQTLGPGTAMRIMTGALVPEGADAVVQVELTDGGTEQVAVTRSVRVGASIRRRGEDMRQGSVVLREGTRITPGEIAILTGVGMAHLAVTRKPVVAIFSTGDELVESPVSPDAGQIVNTNGPMLSALVSAAGGVPRNLGIVRDSHEATVHAFEQALEADFILSSGGVSVGAFDYVKGALETLGAESRFWRVAMKPGKPVVVSRLRDRVVFGLAGNPVSSFVSFHLFVAPALRKAAGTREPWLSPTVTARLATPLRSGGERRVYMRATLRAEEGELVAHPLTSQGSGSLTSMNGVNALAIVGEGVKSIEAGERVATVVIGPLV